MVRLSHKILIVSSSLFLILIVQLWLLNIHYPFIGADMEYYSSRLIDAFLHIKNEGLFTVQWWTPSFGGGIPAFPNPLHLQFSVTPYLMFFFTPWVSTQITYVLMLIIGYVLVFNYVHNHLKFGFYSSLCSAVVFSTNGYFINHSLVGHLNYSSFVLIAIVPYIISSNWSEKKCIVFFSIFMVYLLYSAGFPSIFLIYLSFAQLVFFLPIITKKSICYKKILRIFLLSHLIIIGIGFSKFTAVLLHMDVFPRFQDFFSWQPYFIAFPFSTIAQLFSWRILIPFESILPVPADSVLFWIVGSRYEFWENDVSLSPVVPITLVIFFIVNKMKLSQFISKPKNRLYLLALIAIFWISIEMSIGKGPTWSLIKELPIVKSTHVNVRYTGAMTLFATLLFSFCYTSLIKKKSLIFKKSVTSLIIFISFISMSSYYFISIQKKAYSAYNITNEIIVWEKMKTEHKMSSINQLININSKEQVNVFNKNASSLSPNDPLYGYHGEFFRSSLNTGSIRKIDQNGYFNFHNPMTFYNPKNNSGKRDKIHSSDINNFELFINRKQPHWELPFIQKFANWITIISILILFLYLIKIFFQKLKT